MAIQHRRGAYADFDPSKMKPGEPAAVLSGDPSSSDGKAAYIAFGPGSVKRLATLDDMQAEISEVTEEIIEQVQEGLAEDVERAETAAQDAEAAAASLQLDTTLTVQGRAADAKAVGDKIKAVSEVTAETFSTSKAYAVGDYVIYSDALYKFITAHSAGAWNSAHVSATAVSDEITDLKDDLSLLESSLLSDEIKEALLDCFAHVAWINENGQDYYDALEDALYPETWDFEWDASSETLPTYMTADYYDFTTESGAMFAKRPVLDFEYVGNCKLQIEMKAYSENDGGEQMYNVCNNPQILIKNAIVSENQFRGIKIIMDSVLSTASGHGMAAVSVNGANALIPESNSSEYHIYDLTAENNVYAVMIDNNSVSITQNENTSAYYGRTGITTSAYAGSLGFFGAFIKSIKFKRL